MQVSKLALTNRLQREGRWEEASKRKDDLIREFRKSGLTGLEAKDNAWDQLEEEYPPAPELEVSKKDVVIVNGPSDLWPDLPDNADWRDEIIWVHNQYINIVEETSRGTVVHEDRATQKPPSNGARSLARFAANNRAAFYKDLWPKASIAGSNSGDDDELVREEKRSMAEVTKILEKIGG
ncbi:hypothetical protein M0R72_18165 [Candidatus Pacearchaeota archaeon]|jgi:hypothetical protein|nr:hypothetical protein [Candidatus Pacearchaeota archaeon]